jgi:hypothetical protein
MRRRNIPTIRAAAGLILGALHAPPGFAETADGPAPGAIPDLALVLGVTGFVLLLAFGLARQAWTLRRDFVRLLRASPGQGAALFRDAPAGLPEGSVRAAIAIAIVLVTLPALVLSRLLGLGSSGELGTVLGGVLGYYFGARGGTDPEARRAASAAEAARREAEQATAAARAETAAEAKARRAATEGAEALASARAAEAGAVAAQRPELAARLADAAAAARAIAALLPAGPGAVLREGGSAAEAIGAAIAEPTPARIAAATASAAAALRAVGEGTELADRLAGALQAAGEAAGALAAVEAAVAAPTPERIAAALAAGARVAGGAEGALGQALAPALAGLGTALRAPGVAGALGLAGPAGIAAAVLLGAVEAARIGRAHYQRWVARVLDRPISRDLFPAGEWDGEAARAVIAEEPLLAAALARHLSADVPQRDAAAALADLLEPGAGARLFAAAPGIFASEAEAEAAVARLRRRLLEAELDRADPHAQARGAPLRAELDRLREAGAGEALDTLLLLADGVIAARPEGAAALLRGAVAAAEAPARALERDPRGAAPTAGDVS